MSSGFWIRTGLTCPSQEAMKTGDPLRAPQAGQAAGVHVVKRAAAGGAVPCRVIGGTRA